MAAFVIAEVTVSDPDQYEQYKPMATASVDGHGGRYIVRGGKVESLEGSPVDGRFVVLEFPDLDSARRWYYSEEYTAARAVRQAASTGRVFIVDGVEPA